MSEKKQEVNVETRQVNPVVQLKGYSEAIPQDAIDRMARFMLKKMWASDEIQKQK